MFTRDEGTLPPLRLVPGGVDRASVGRGAGGESAPPPACRRRGAGAALEMLREAAVTMERALRAAGESLASDGASASSTSDEWRDEFARQAVRLVDLAVDVPSPALRAAALRAGADCRDLANVLYRGPTPGDLARAAARLDALRAGCDVLEEQLSDALREMLRASLCPPKD